MMRPKTFFTILIPQFDFLFLKLTEMIPIMRGGVFGSLYISVTKVYALYWLVNPFALTRFCKTCAVSSGI